MTDNLPSPDRLRQLLHFAPETGFLYWRPRPVAYFGPVGHWSGLEWKRWTDRYQGKRAFKTINGNRHYGVIDCRRVMADRVVWAMRYGKWPDGRVIHLDGDGTNNRISNLCVKLRLTPTP